MTSQGITRIEIGMMRSRITFQENVDVSDGQGGQSRSWSNISINPTVWAYLKPISSRERLYSQQIQYQRSHTALIRYREDIDNTMQVTYQGRTFQIKGFIDPDERKEYLQIDLDENKGT